MHRSGSKNQDSVVKTELEPRHLQASIESTARSLGLEAMILVDVLQQDPDLVARVSTATLETLVLQQDAGLVVFFVSLNTA
jgi:hypothetical protein